MGLSSSRAAVAALAAALVAVSTSADEIVLRGGGRVRGIVVEQTQDRVVVETGPGRVTLPMARVERILQSRSALEVYAERAAGLAPGDREGWASLARWAAERELGTQAREAWQSLLAVDPSHPEANAALGRVPVDGVWMGEDEAYRARGYVSFEGRWVTPPEHEALVRERAAEEEAAREQREAGLRVREAEARAREAEARAREAEAAAQPTDGIPLWWGWGGGGYLPPFVPDVDRPERHPHGPDVPRRGAPSNPAGPTTRPSARRQAPAPVPAGIQPPPLPKGRPD